MGAGFRRVQQAAGVVAVAMLAGCGLFDDAKNAVNDIQQSVNAQLAEADRTSGLLTDPALRDSAMARLRKIIPDSLVVASNLASAGETYADKLAALQGVLDLGGLGTDSTALGHCLGALPGLRTARSNPTCYGPTLAFVDTLHPDYTGAGPLQPTGPGGAALLPPFDLGLWNATEGGTEACAAAKLNQLTHDAAWAIDLANGAMAMTVCVAAFHGDTLPGSGVVHEFAAELARANPAGMTITAASVANDGGTFVTTFAAAIEGEQVSFTVRHDPDSQAGLVSAQSAAPQQGGAPGGNAGQFRFRSTSLKYVHDQAGIHYRMASAGYNDSAKWVASLDGMGEVNPTATSWDNDLHLMSAQVVPGGATAVAYGWQAGSGDGFLRVFNAATAGTTGTAWFGYAPHGNETMEQLGTLLAIDRMICNWAGPGNSHTGQPLAQRQTIALESSVWVPVASDIAYAPTNSCTVSDAAVFPSLGALPTHGLAPLTEYDFSVPVLP